MQMRLFIPREHARVDDLNASLEAVLANNGVSPAIQGDVRLIVEELASNAIEHGDLHANVKRWATEQWEGNQLPGNINRLETFIDPAELAAWQARRPPA